MVKRSPPLLQAFHHPESAVSHRDPRNRAETVAKAVDPMRAALKRERRAQRERELAAATLEAARTLGRRTYNVILADPPWTFRVYSEVTGQDRGACNHYPTMTLAEIKKLPLPAAKDCALFLWVTVPMLQLALEVMTAWGFAYKSSFVWVKDKVGTGYWSRNKHELLLIGTRGDIPCPAPGTQFDSVIEAPRGRHSEKPAIVREMIAQMFPTVPKLEMFARGRAVPDWDVWGNEVENDAEATPTPIDQKGADHHQPHAARRVSHDDE